MKNLLIIAILFAFSFSIDFSVGGKYSKEKKDLETIQNIYSKVSIDVSKKLFDYSTLVSVEYSDTDEKSIVSSIEVGTYFTEKRKYKLYFITDVEHSDFKDLQYMFNIGVGAKYVMYRGNILEELSISAIPFYENRKYIMIPMEDTPMLSIRPKILFSGNVVSYLHITFFKFYLGSDYYNNIGLMINLEQKLSFALNKHLSLDLIHNYELENAPKMASYKQYLNNKFSFGLTYAK